MIIRLKYRSILQSMANRRKCHRRNRTRSSTKTIRKTISATMFLFRRQRTISINITTTLATTFDRNSSRLDQVSSTPTPVKINSQKTTKRVNTRLISSCSTFLGQTLRISRTTFASTSCYSTFTHRIQTVDLHFTVKTSIFPSRPSNPTESTTISTEIMRIISTDQVTRRTHTF